MSLPMRASFDSLSWAGPALQVTQFWYNIFHGARAILAPATNGGWEGKA